MSESKFSVHETGGAPLKLWDSEGAFEQSAMDQLWNVSQLPIIHGHVAGMPDVHMGYGATVGSVIPTKGAIVPAAVGVDIGCGMVAQRTTLTANDVPSDLKPLRAAIERKVPHGRTNDGKAGDRGAWSNVPAGIVSSWRERLEARYQKISAENEKIGTGKAIEQLGTLGGGNHFIEVCLDEEDRVWVMLHSGSRGVGNRIGQYFMRAAKEDMAKSHQQVTLHDADLAFLTENTKLFDDYVEAMTWAQDFAYLNREIMMARTLEVMRDFFPTSFQTDKHAVNCHHNYATKETHFGEEVWITRKGAVRAGKGDLGIIPGSMGTGSFIVRGLGNEESFCSCSHGAGRVMSRTKAKQLITLEQHVEAMRGIEGPTDARVLDESPAAYKPIEKVMDAQTDLVEVVHKLRQIVNVKG